jgi:hypothetical protein
MKYYVYVNKPTSKARIHWACGYCNDDNAKRRTKNGEWHKFNTLKEAEGFVRKSNKKHVSKCKNCLKKENLTT